MTSKIFLVGLPGSGKTTYGQRLADDIGYSFFDLDDLIVQKEGKAIGEIFEEKGEGYFRKVEQQCLYEMINISNNYVLATGGGTPCFFDNMQQMNTVGKTVYIDTPLSAISKRLEKEATRPLMKVNKLEGLNTKRRQGYKKSTHTVVAYHELVGLFKN